MSNMFAHCSNLTTIDVSNFDTQNVEEWKACSLIATLPSSTSPTSTQNVMTMGWMFYRCTNLEELNISNFNTECGGHAKYVRGM